MVNVKKCSGFALLEILVATVLLCGLVYMYISFNQNQQRMMDAANKGRLLSIGINEVVKQIANNTSNPGKCPLSAAFTSGSMTSCVNFSNGFKESLNNNGLGSITLTIS